MSPENNLNIAQLELYPSVISAANIVLLKIASVSRVIFDLNGSRRSASDTFAPVNRHLVTQRRGFFLLGKLIVYLDVPIKF